MTKQEHGTCYYTDKDNAGKECPCVGPEKCKDKTCPLVKQHKNAQGSMGGWFGGRCILTKQEIAQLQAKCNEYFGVTSMVKGFKHTIPVSLEDGWLAIETFRGLADDSIGVDLQEIIFTISKKAMTNQQLYWLVFYATPLEIWQICVLAKEAETKSKETK